MATQKSFAAELAAELTTEQAKWLDQQLAEVNIALADSTDRHEFLDVWQRFVQRSRQSSEIPIIPAVFQVAWGRVFQNWDTSSWGPAPVWVPDKNQKSNVGRWMQELGFGNFQSFHQWTIQNRTEFWKQAIERLGIRFAFPPRQILHNTSTAAHPVWLPEAKLNIAESCFQAEPEQPAIIFQRPGQAIEAITYAGLKQLAHQVANSLAAIGIQPGDAVAVVLPMTALSVPIYLGIVLAGCVVVSIADSFAAPEIATRLNIANAKLIFTYDYILRGGKRLPLYQRVVDASKIPAVVLPAQAKAEIDLRFDDLTWEDFFKPSTQFSSVIAEPNDTINLLFSSGTTGEPKAIPWNHTTPIKCAIDGYCHQDIQPGQVCVWPTNLGWMMGPWLIFATLINRATIGIYEDVPTSAGFGQFVADAKVNMLGVVPSIVKAWRSSRQMEALDWSSIRVFSSTGESSQPDDMLYLSALAEIKPIIEYCGGTEIGGGYITSTLTEPNVPASFNTPAVGIDLVLLDEAGGLADEGEVFLIPPSIGLSTHLLNRDHEQTYYAGVPELPGVESLRRHGDYFRRLPGKIYQAGGRVDDTMNLGGIKISSAEIERVLNLLPDIQETAAVAYSPDGGPDQLFVFAVKKESDNAVDVLDSMNQQLKQQLNPLFKISQVIIRESLPRTASGKVMRRELRNDLVQLPVNSTKQS